MQTITDPVFEDMEQMGQEDFAAMYCADEIKDQCMDCEECQRSGACCLTCRFRLDCPYVCRSERARVKLDDLSVEELCQKIQNDNLLTFVVTNRLRLAENRVVELIEKHIKQCLSCEKLDLAAQIVELNGYLENMRNLMKSDRKIRLRTMNTWLKKYNIPYDCGWRDAVDKLIAGGTEEKL